MAANVYLEEAAKRLRDAASALRDDISAAQNDAYRRESQLRSEIAQAEVRSSEARAEFMAAPAHLKPALEARRHQLDSEVREKKAEVDRVGAEAAREVQAKNNVLTRLQGITNQLESLAASVR
jgi:hypothetical protein